MNPSHTFNRPFPHPPPTKLFFVCKVCSFSNVSEQKKFHIFFVCIYLGFHNETIWLEMVMWSNQMVLPLYLISEKETRIIRLLLEVTSKASLLYLVSTKPTGTLISNKLFSLNALGCPALKLPDHRAIYHSAVAIFPPLASGFLRKRQAACAL